MRKYDNNDIKQLLYKFRNHLSCWEVGLSFGSFVYFNMGKKLLEKMKDGSEIKIGSAILVVESDIWTMTWRNNSQQKIKITDSDSITQDWINRMVFKYIVNTSLMSLKYVSKTRECVVHFSESGETPGNISIRLRGGSNEDMCTLTLPDGTIIVCNAKNGFFSDESRSDVHALAYTSSPLL